MVILTEQRQAINEKTQELVDRSDAILEDYLAKDIPDVKLNADSNRDEIIDELDVDVPKISRNQREEEYKKLKKELLIKLEKQPYKPRFDWKEAMKAGVRRMRISEQRSE